MTIPLLDIVFQNDRYYLLFDDERILQAMDTREWYVYAEEEYICSIKNCKVSELLKVPGKIFLETQENLNKLENIFRKLKNVVLSSDKINH
ncbi:hypothetical protein SAMN05421866_2610 [Chryseobacterium oranimense]|uniref:Uncharacterized protein n=1 Tax=Chryseobacterium oranimense TaxID=421058 RepID=A0A1M5S2B6_9FLAO|nr:hypothetical protein [Chryseobacterium oranimense]SHH32595.1 hypothetical protein SAMN05421866_2610 [Chryseobacterium oranimense]